MSGSVVFYRFKAQKEASTVQFEGTGISVWDLKKEILADNKLGKGADFDFAIYNADTNDEYSDDKAIVPRSTSVIARRLPPSKPGRGNAQYYMVQSAADTQAGSTGPGRASAAGQAGRHGHFSKRFDGKEDSPVKPSPSQQPRVIPTSASTDSDEAARIAAMFATTSEQWNATQEKMSAATPVFYGNRRPGMPRPAHQNAAPEKPVPAGYVCYRCGQTGHWIQDCPTNDKPEWDNKPRIKRTTGIPKSFLQTVEGPSKDGENQAGVMITADGGFVVARPDAASWEKHRAVQANLTSSDVQNAAPTDPDLTCTLCNRLLRDAVKTPCCSKSYCEECIHNYLSENDFVCPECESKIKSLKNLVKDDDRRERAKNYLEDTLKASKEASEGQSKGTDDGSDKASENGSKNGDSSDKKPTIKLETGGPPEEGELAGDDTASKGRSQSPRSTGTSAAPINSQTSQSSIQSGMNGNGMMATGSGLGQNQQAMNQMNSMFNNFNNNFGNSMPPQLQMVQNQIQQTMNILQSPSLPPQMRVQLVAQLQGLQFQYAQMTQMMGNGGFGGNMQQQMMAQAMQRLQHTQQLMMMQEQQRMYQNNMFNGFQNGMQNAQAMQQQTGQRGVQYEEDSADSPYMRVPANPKFRQGGVKRERPEDFREVVSQVKRYAS